MLQKLICDGLNSDICDICDLTTENRPTQEVLRPARVPAVGGGVHGGADGAMLQRPAMCQRLGPGTSSSLVLWWG